ncbi:hypothetical protein V3C99_005418 [Haemonchus contortus]
MILRILLCLLAVFSKTAALHSKVKSANTFVALKMFVDHRMTCVYQPLKKNVSLSIIAKAPNALVKLRLTTPSGQKPPKLRDNSPSALIRHNVTQEGDYEICLSASTPSKVFMILLAIDEGSEQSRLLNKDPEEHIHKEINSTLDHLNGNALQIALSLRMHHLATRQDDEVQQSNAGFIVKYVILFNISSITVAIVEVALVRWMFQGNSKYMRI